MPENLIGIDIGTTTICGVLISRTGELLSAVERPNDSAAAGLPAGRAEQDPGRVRERAFEVLRELADRDGHIGGIGITGQMHGMLCVDGSNEPVSRLITWQDGRCLETTPGGGTWLDEMRDRVRPDHWDSCGCLPASGFLGSTLFWMVANQALPAGTVRVSFIHDWIAAQLAGQLPLTDPSDAGSSGVFDLETLSWHRHIVRALGLPEPLLPPVRESGEVIGRLSAEAARRTGLPAGVPVCNAAGDNQASVIGSIADMDRSVLINVGTGGQISWAIPAFRRVPGMETRYLPRGRYMLVGASLCGGRAYAWLNDVVRAWLGEFGRPADRGEIYARLNELAAAAPADRGGLSASTTLAGTRADPALRGGLSGVSLDNFSLGNVARSILVGMVDELCSMYDGAGGRTGCRHVTAVASGNAVRKNPLLSALIGGRTGCPVRIPRHREEAAFGAALLAGVGTGVWPDLARAGECVAYR
jgi:sugar (pentulose or hexulose) kinase